ncbi:hypothetical protein D3C81_2293460 [compost metagenome]
MEAESQAKWLFVGGEGVNIHNPNPRFVGGHHLPDFLADMVSQIHLACPGIVHVRQTQSRAALRAALSGIEQ